MWERVLGVVRGEVSDLHYRAWLARSLLVEVGDTEAVVLLPNDYIAAQVRQRWVGVLEQALAQVLDRSCALTFRAAAPAGDPLAPGRGCGR